MHGLSIAIATGVDGHLRLVVSHVGRVIYQASALLPHNPSPADIATALRKFANAVDELPLLPNELPK